MYQFKFLIKDIRNNKLIVAVFVFVNIIAMFLVSNLLPVIGETLENFERVDVFRRKNAYIVEDSTPDSRIQEIISDETSLDKMSKYYKTLYDNNISFYTCFGYDIYMSSHA